MEESSMHLLGIINDILDFSKIESGELVLSASNFSLKHNIDFVVSMFKEKIEQKRLNFSVELNNIEHDGIVADKLRLNQILINLLSNAIKFTDTGGSVMLTVEELAHIEGESVYQFVVQDSGIGIEPEQAKKLFTPFTQANVGVSHVYGGTGLGLSIAQNIVQMMGGEIELETEPGYGALFQFTIRTPATKESDENPAKESKRTIPGKLLGKCILIVDDIEINREIMTELLDGSGALIEEASNGKEAFDMFCTGEAYRYDLILMDMLMPVMDGCDATMAIRASGKADAKDVKIIAMTANVLPEDVERAFLAGMNAYLVKPVEIETLYAKLEEWL
jgi:CheY-like chemotaxis protein